MSQSSQSSKSVKEVSLVGQSVKWVLWVLPSTASRDFWSCFSCDRNITSSVIRPLSLHPSQNQNCHGTIEKTCSLSSHFFDLVLKKFNIFYFWTIHKGIPSKKWVMWRNMVGKTMQNYFDQNSWFLEKLRNCKKFP